MCQVENAFLNKRRKIYDRRALELSSRYVICRDRDRNRESIVSVCGLMCLCIHLICLKSRAYAVTFITVVST